MFRYQKKKFICVSDFYETETRDPILLKWLA